MPLTPLFDLIDVALAVKKVLDKLKSLDVPGTIRAFPDFVSAVDKLLALIPQTSIPRMLLSTIDVLLAVLNVLRLDFEAIGKVQVPIDTGNARAAALGSADLAATLMCSQSQLNARLVLLQARAQPLNRLLGVLNALSGIAGAPELPTLSLSGNAQACIDTIDSVTAALRTVRSVIPV